MSGPKISVYQLNDLGRKLVFGQMRCEHQSVLCARQIQELIHQTLSYGNELQQQLSRLGILERRGQSTGEKQKQLLNLSKKLESETSQIKSRLTANMPHISAKYRITEEALAEKKKELSQLRELKKQIQDLREEVDIAVSHEAENGSLVSETIQRSISEDLGGYISFNIPVDDSPDTSFEDDKTKIRNKLSSLLIGSALPQDIMQDIKKAIIALDKIYQPEYLRSFDSVTVKNILKRIDTYKHDIAAKEIEFNEAYSRYQMLCSIVNEPAKLYQYSEEAFTEMDADIQRLEFAVVEMQEQSYVSECVDQVMSEMGYDLIGSRDVTAKRTGKRFHNELFTFNEGTAVNVTYSSDGQISMELGGIAREDRIPDQEETEMLTKDMQTFCGEFAEFERRLKEKGVVVNHRIAFYPPSAEHASIINVSDYDIVNGIQITEMTSVDRKKKRTGKKSYGGLINEI